MAKEKGKVCFRHLLFGGGNLGKPMPLLVLFIKQFWVDLVLNF